MKNECPDESDLRRTFLDEMSAGKKRKIIDHAFTCAKCRLKFEGMMKIRRELTGIEQRIEGIHLGREGKNVVTNVQFLTRLRYRHAVAAFLILISLTAGSYFVIRSHQERNILRDGGGAEVELIEPKGRLSSPPVQFFWKPVVKAEIYYVKVIGEDLTTVFKLGTEENRHILNPEEKARLLKIGVYIWSVTAINDEGRKIGFAQGYFEIR
jgi:hypothetical protein